VSNVGGSAGGGGFDFQASLIAYIAIYILAEISLPGLERAGIPTAISAETSGPGDDVQIEFSDGEVFVELQAKKGLRADTRFDEAIDKIASGLNRNSSSDVILAVDPRSTQRIREKLPFDLDRLRQGRSDSPQDQELLNRVLHIFTKIAASEECAVDLISHFFVTVFDLEGTASRETHSAINLLQSHILLDKAQALAAWDILVRDGHQLIKGRGRRDAAGLVRLLQSRGIRLPGSLLPLVKEQYQQWLLTYTATFTMPGPSLGKPLPIENAWVKLRMLSKQPETISQGLEAQLAAYHEWERLALREDLYEAEDVGQIEHRVVIIGGPGSGKSTLCRKLAHDLTAREELVLWVHLPEVASRMSNSMNIHDALIDAATNGLPLAASSRDALYKKVDCLIADGLDECGSLLLQVAEGLQRWASARQGTRVVITTRPVGYDASFFKGWTHQELLPLSKDQVERSAHQIIVATSASKPVADEHFQRFEGQLGKNHVASLAARNPLLLGFIVQLTMAGVTVAPTRANLYEQILDLWYKTLPKGREVAGKQPGSSLAQRSLDILGWLLQTVDKRGDRLLKKLVQQLSAHLSQEMDLKQAQAQELAEACLSFWQERGVIERLQFMNEDTYAFVHPTLGEYAAARYFVTLDPAEIQRHVLDKRVDPRWREVLLLAAGLGAVDGMVETLLAVPSPNQHTAPELFLAAGALAESDRYSPSLAAEVADQLRARLLSSDPSVVYQTARQAKGFAAQAPDLVGPIIQPLCTHQQQWTRLAATNVALASDPGRVEVKLLELLLREVLTNPITDEGNDISHYIDTGEWIPDSDDGWHVQNDVIALGAARIARTRPDGATIELLQALYLSSAVGRDTKSTLASVLVELGDQDFVEQHEPISAQSIWNSYKRSLLADQKMLEVIIRITNVPVSPSQRRRKLTALTTLIHALPVSEEDPKHWDVLYRLDEVTAIETVLSGFIQLYKINLKELALDAAWALARVQEALQNERPDTALQQLLPKIPVKLDWPQDPNLNVSPLALVRALNHPSAIIANGAILLLIVGVKREELENAFQEMNREIRKNEQMKIIIARIVSYMWKNEVPSWLQDLLKPNETIK